MVVGNASVSVLAVPVQVVWAETLEDASNNNKDAATPSKLGKSLDRARRVGIISVVMSIFRQVVGLACRMLKTRRCPVYENSLKLVLLNPFLRRMTLNLLRTDTTTKAGIKNRRFKAAISDSYRALILGFSALI